MPTDPPTAAWGRVLKRADLHVLADALRFRTEGYTRTRIAHRPSAEVLLMGWLPGQETLVHDHGDIQARVFIVSGRATETEYEEKGDHSRILKLRTLRAGDEFRERPGSIHKVTCVGDAPLVTLHLNSPPLVQMHTYGVGAVSR